VPHIADRPAARWMMMDCISQGFVCVVKNLFVIFGRHKVVVLDEMCAVLDVDISGYRAWKRDGKPDWGTSTDPVSG